MVTRPLRNAFRAARNTVGAMLVSIAVRALLRTVRYRVSGWEDARAAAWERGGVVYAFWHNVMMLPLGHASRRKTVALVSPGSDGTFAARIIRFFGVLAIRGSTHEQAASGVMELLRARPGHCSLAVTPDGPRGPRYQARSGAVYLASRGGLPIVPIGIALSKSWRLGSWDRFRIPKPFARAEMIFGAPRAVPDAIDRQAIDDERQWLQNELCRLSSEAHQRVGASWPD